MHDFIKQHDGVFRESSPLARDGTRKTHIWANFLLPDGTSISTGYDITKRKEAEEQLRQLASFDTLTGLPNRALFLDLDHFKKIKWIGNSKAFSNLSYLSWGKRYSKLARLFGKIF